MYKQRTDEYHDLPDDKELQLTLTRKQWKTLASRFPCQEEFRPAHQAILA